MNTKSEDNVDPHNFRENMKKWRKIRGMSQDDLARTITENPPESLNFHQQTIQKIENGNRGISLTDAVLISVALQVDLNTMLTGTDSPDKTLDEIAKDKLRRRMHIAELAVKELESTIEHLGKVFDIEPQDEQRESVAREIREGPAPRHSDVDIFDNEAVAEANEAAERRHADLHEQIGEHLENQAAENGVDN